MEKRIGRSTNRLSDRTIRAFLGSVKTGKVAATKKLSDGGGLFLTTTPAGSAVWRMKYRHGGREKVYSIGLYPTIDLADARAARETAKAHLREGRDPTTARQLDRVATTAASVDTFAAVAESWLEKQKGQWSEIHFLKSQQAIERDVYPALGSLPISQITSPMIAHVVETIAGRGAVETASKVLWNLERIFHLAKTRGLCKTNPAVGVREVLPKTKQHSQRPALLTFPALGELLRKFEGAPISPSVRICHKLIAYTASRIGNAITADWAEFDLGSDMPTWTIPRNRMKSKDRKHDHRVLLGPSIASELRTWKSITG